MSKSDTRRTAEENTYKGAREKIMEAIVNQARMLADHFDYEIKMGTIRVPSFGIRVRVDVQILDSQFPELVRGSLPLTSQRPVDFSGDDFKKPNEGIVMMLEANERKWNAGLLCPKCSSENLGPFAPNEDYRHCSDCGHFFPISRRGEK